jgi:hypothetical protein
MWKAFPLDGMVFHLPSIYQRNVYFYKELSMLQNRERKHMNNLASSLLKLTALLGGATLGALLGRWFDKVLSERVKKQSESDRTRYAQGLAPISQQQER